jgi:hypothetical protein
MNIFVLGVLVGGAVVGIIAALLFINTKLKTVIAQLHILTGKMVKMEKVTDTTMLAAENFVDALHSSAHQMGMRPFNGPRTGSPDDFDDLRETFEGGIRNLEDEPEDSEDDEENWKKGP